MAEAEGPNPEAARRRYACKSDGDRIEMGVDVEAEGETGETEAREEQGDESGVRLMS